MAVTSLWRIKGRIDKVVDYASNPEKTERPAFDGEEISTVIGYAMQQEKTTIVSDEGEQILRQFVFGINCCPSTAVSEMMAVKKHFKTAFCGMPTSRPDRFCRTPRISPTKPSASIRRPVPALP